MPSSQHRHYYQVDSTIAAEESQALLTFSQQQFSRGGEHENQPPPSAWGIALDKKPPFSITKGLLLHAHCGGNGTFGSDKFEIDHG